MSTHIAIVLRATLPAVAIGVVTLVAMQLVSAGTAAPSVGDVNGDGRVDAVDASFILQLSAGLIDHLPAEATPTPTPVPPDVAVIELPGTGFDMETDAARHLLYVSAPSSNDIVLVSTETNQVVDTVHMGGQRPMGIDLSIDGSRLFVALNQAGAVGVIDLETLAWTEILVGDATQNSLIYDVVEGKPDRLYVSASPSSGGVAYLALVKLDEGNAASSIQSGGIIRAEPTLLASPDMKFLYVGEGFSPNSLYKFDIATDDPQLVLEDDHGSVSGTDNFDISPDGTRIYLSSGQVLRTASFIQAGFSRVGVPRVSADGTRLYVGTSGSPGTEGTVFEYERESLTELRELPTSCSPWHIEEAEGTGLYVLGDDLVCLVSLAP